MGKIDRVLALSYLIDIIVGFVAGVVTAVFTDETGIQICAGLIGMAFAAAWSHKLLISRVQDRISDSNVTRQVLELGLAEDLLKIQRFFNLVKSAIIYHRNLPKIETIARDLVDESISQTTLMMEHVEHGQVPVALEDIRQHGMKIVDAARRGDTLLATSYISTPIWWGVEQGRDYLKHKVNAASEGVNVVQIFISHDEDELKRDEWIFGVMSESELGEKGIPIRLYAINEARLARAQCRDVLLLKAKGAFELSLEERVWIKGFVIHVLPSPEIGQIEEYFDALLSQPYLVLYEPDKYIAFGEFVAHVFR